MVFLNIMKFLGKCKKKVGYKIVGKTKNFCPALNSEVVEVVTNLKKGDFFIKN